MKKWKQTAGFTLVELIVVIAILGILAGVGTVGYSGYIKKANKAADQQMVAGMVYGMELAAIADPVNFPSDATVYLSTAPAQVTGPNGNDLDKILTDTYGSGYENQLKLKYKQWALGGTVSVHAKTLNTKLSSLGKELSFVNDVDVFWDEVEEILTGLETTATMDAVYGGDAGLMAAAAGYTTGNNGQVAEDFATSWVNLNADFNGLGAAYDSTAARTEEALNPMLAKCAAIKARNYAFGNWLKANYSDLTDVATGIQDASSNLSVGGVGVPENFMDDLKGGNGVFSGLSTDQWRHLDEALQRYFGVTTTFDTVFDPPIMNITEAANATVTATQAYADALGYHTLMQAVSDSAGETQGIDNETYKNTMAGAVHNVGALLNDPTTLNNLQDGCVAISVKKAEDGTITYYITPADIYLGSANAQSGVGESTVQLNDAVTVTVSLTEEGYQCTPSGSLVLKAGTTGTINVEVDESCKVAYRESIADPNDSYYGWTLEQVIAAEMNSLGIYSGWTSSDSSVATIDGTTVEAHRAGVSVQLVNNRAMATVQVKVVS